jgi:septum formation protein
MSFPSAMKIQDQKGKGFMGLHITGRFILASASPRRVELLKRLGLEVEVMPSGVDESFLDGETPEEHVLRLSRHKSDIISSLNPEAWVLGADTIVIIKGEVLGKPRTPEDARQMLGKLSGQEHLVYTGFTIRRREDNRLASKAMTSSVIFKDLSEQEMAWYADSAEPYDKAGGYAVQGLGAFFIREIRGSYTNVMGLPLCEVVDTLKDLGALRFI